MKRYDDEVDEPAHSTTRDRATTILAVVGALFLVGHVTALFPDGQASGWASAAAFVALVLAYATLTGPGRRSGADAFLTGGMAVLPPFFLWFAVIVGISDQNWYYRMFSGFQVGFSGRGPGWGHAGALWFIVWPFSIMAMVAMALVIRRLVVRSG